MQLRKPDSFARAMGSQEAWSPGNQCCMNWVAGDISRRPCRIGRLLPLYTAPPLGMRQERELAGKEHLGTKPRWTTNP